MKSPHVYIMTNKYKTVLYTGVTSDLIKRVYQHKNNTHKGFTFQYNCHSLVYFKAFDNIVDAISYEKKIKAGNRKNKEKLINSINPEWNDLSETWVP